MVVLLFLLFRSGSLSFPYGFSFHSILFFFCLVLICNEGIAWSSSWAVYSWIRVCLFFVFFWTFVFFCLLKIILLIFRFFIENWRSSSFCFLPFCFWFSFLKKALRIQIIMSYFLFKIHWKFNFVFDLMNTYNIFFGIFNIVFLLFWY